jgi:hypothetical protein
MKTVNQKDEIKAYLKTNGIVIALVAIGLVVAFLIARMP